MRHSDQFKAPIEDAEHFITLKIQRADIALNLFVGGGKTESKIAITLVQGNKVIADSASMTLCQ